MIGLISSIASTCRACGGNAQNRINRKALHPPQDVVPMNSSFSTRCSHIEAVAAHTLASGTMSVEPLTSASSMILKPTFYAPSTSLLRRKWFS